MKFFCFLFEAGLSPFDGQFARVIGTNSPVFESVFEEDTTLSYTQLPFGFRWVIHKIGQDAMLVTPDEKTSYLAGKWVIYNIVSKSIGLSITASVGCIEKCDGTSSPSASKASSS